MIKAKRKLTSDLIKWLLIALPISVLPVMAFYAVGHQNPFVIYAVQLIYTVLWLMVGLFAYIRYAKLSQDEMKSLVKKEKLINSSLVMINTEEKLKNILSLEIERIALIGASSVLVFFDVDELGHINENYGYDVGDQIIIDLIMASKAVMGKNDTLGRIKGDTFCILSPGQSKPHGYALARRLQSDIQKASKEKGIHITCRFVVMALEGWTTDEQLLSLAYEQLKLAKETGRGTIF